MDDDSAASRADTILIKIIENSPEAIYKGALGGVERAEEAAEAIAAFRRRLIVKLAEQPE